MNRWFLPETPDVLGMLREQAAVTIEGMNALIAWATGDPDGAQQVRDLEHHADDHKRELRKALRAAFTTPLDAEDIYVLSERLDAVMNGAKDAVRESEVMACGPDEAMAEMSRHLADGVRHLGRAIAQLEGDGDVATTEADAAIKCQRHLEWVYRAAMSDLIDREDLREVMSRRELYRRYSRIGDTLVEVAERVWYAVVKES